ncbi:MAG: hypothetical protein JWR24_858 [Actinoallomurus sp.]|jgi:methyl-accepting chemotaxis protein|nr:hypothetical protein [Actinoallomurus sp.]
MTITDKLRDNKAFYAAAGAGDFAVEKLREMPDRLNKLQEKADPKDLGGAAVAYMTHAGSRAVEVFDELAERGKKIVSRVERQKATQELEASARSTVRKARSTAGSAKETAGSVKETAGSAKETAGSAKETARTTAKAVGDASKKIGT